MKVIVVFMLSFLLFGCSFQQTIRFKLSKESGINSKIACDTIYAVLSRKGEEKPYKLKSIKTSGGITVFELYKNDWGYFISLDAKCNVVNFFGVIKAY